MASKVPASVAASKENGIRAIKALFVGSMAYHAYTTYTEGFGGVAELPVPRRTATGDPSSDTSASTTASASASSSASSSTASSSTASSSTASTATAPATSSASATKASWPWKAGVDLEEIEAIKRRGAARLEAQLQQNRGGGSS